MRALPRVRVPALLSGAALLVVVAAASPALAAWFVGPSTTDALAGAGTVAAPTGVGASPATSSVALSWTGVPVATGYTVLRTAPTSAAVCVGITTTTCTDTGLSPSTAYSYQVVSLRGPWTSTPASATATTTAPSPSAFLVTVPATATAGTAFTVDVQARTSAGANDTAYTGTHALTLSGPGSVGSSSPSYPASATFTNGHATFGVTLFKAETVTLTVSDGDPVRTGVSNPVAVAPRAGVAMRYVSDASGLTDGCPGGSLAVGVGGQRTWYVGVLDTYGNRAVQGAGALAVKVKVLSGTGTVGGANMSVPAGANPAVTSTAATLKLKRNPAVTTQYQASGGGMSVTCTLSP